MFSFKNLVKAILLNSHSILFLLFFLSEITVLSEKPFSFYNNIDWNFLTFANFK